MRLIKTKKVYKDVDGNEKNSYEFYLEVEGVSRPLRIDPHKFGDKSNFQALSLVAVYISDYGKSRK